MHFYLLYEILDAPLHGVSVNFNDQRFQVLSRVLTRASVDDRAEV